MLEGTFAEPGVPWADFGRTFSGGLQAIQSAMGKDSQQAKNTAAAFDRFKALSTDFGIDLLTRLKGVTITDAKFNRLMANTVSTGNSPEANRLAIADIVEVALDSADELGMDLAERNELNALYAQLRSGSPAAKPGDGPAPGTVDGGYRFIGGNPADPNNWERVQ